MPAFFVIAGFFSALMLTKYSPKEFLVRRLQRLAVPLVTFVGIDIAIDCANLSNWTDYSQELSRKYWVTGQWLEHLWFLATLLTYVVVLFAFHWRSSESKWIRLRVSPIAFVLGIAVISFGFGHLERALPGAPWRKMWFFADQVKLFEYAGFFIAGYLLFHQRAVLNSLSRNVGWNAASIVLFWVATPFVAGIPWA